MWAKPGVSLHLQVYGGEAEDPLDVAAFPGHPALV